MAQTLLRGRTLSFLRWPDDTNDRSAYRYEEDGGLLIEDGRIVAAGAYADVSAKAGEGARRIDHRPHLILPGFIDAHVHFPQMQVIASYGEELLDWLNKYTFPEETKFRDAQHGRRIARLFLAQSRGVKDASVAPRVARSFRQANGRVPIRPCVSCLPVPVCDEPSPRKRLVRPK